MFWHIIINPTAGNGNARLIWPQIENLLQQMSFSYSVHFTERVGHAIQLAETAVMGGGRFVLSVGGDGTHHEVANGILRQNRTPSNEVSLAALPIGTGNDWVKQYGVEKNIATRLQRLLNPEFVYQDVGRVRYYTEDGAEAERYFINVAGLAYDGYVAQRVEAEGKTGSKLAYLIAVARYLFDYEPQTVALHYDDHQVVDRFYTINVGICRYSGGGMQLVPHAVPDDGKFALTFARHMPRWEVLAQTRRFYNGSLLSHPKVTGAQVREVTVDAASLACPLEADGEFLGYAPAAFELLPGALRVAK